MTRLKRYRGSGSGLVSKAAEQGYELAEFSLGMLYHSGDALHWLSLAAKHHILPAQTQLTRLYDTGPGIEKNCIKTFYGYSEAATLGDLGAQGAN